MVCRGLFHHSLPEPRLTHLEATTIQIMLAVKPVITNAANVSPSVWLNAADLYTCFGGGLPFLLAGYLNAQHVDWNSGLSTRREKTPSWLCRQELSSELWAGQPNHKPVQPLCYIQCIKHREYQRSPLLGASDYVLCTRYRPPPGTYRHVVWFILSAPPCGPGFRRTESAKFHTHLEAEIPFNAELHNAMAFGTCVDNSTVPFLSLWQLQLLSVGRVTKHSPLYRLAFMIKNGWVESSRSPCIPLRELNSTTFRCWWPTGSTGEGVWPSDP
jgi:hypothetical protein